MAQHRIFAMRFGDLYPHYVAKAERKGRTAAEVDAIITWLTGYNGDALAAVVASDADVAAFFADAPRLNPARDRVTGVVCGVRVEEVEDPLMREIRRLDRLIDELARGRPMEKILRD